jgi:hypothetical protein
VVAWVSQGLDRLFGERASEHHERAGAGSRGALQAHASAGQQADFSRSALASVFIGTAEANKFLVQNFYEKFLHRPAGSDGLIGVIQARQNGMTEETVIAAFLGSDEYYKQAIQ